jgi:hypothetical protein
MRGAVISGGVAALVAALVLSGPPSRAATAAAPRITPLYDVQILYVWGTDGRNRLDTLSGTVTKDLVADGQATAPLELSASELARILAVADSVGFFRLPLDIQPSPVTGAMTPCATYLLRISKGPRFRTVQWDDCNSGPSIARDRANTIGRAIERLVQQKEAFRRLPESRGGYM